MLAVEPSLMSNVIWRANHTSSMTAFEAAPVICSPINCNPLNGIYCLLASNTLLSGSCKCTWDFVGYWFLRVNRFFWFDNLWGPFKAFVQAASPLEELIKVWSAIEYSLERIIISQLQSSLTVVASKTGLVVDSVVGGELVHKVDRLTASCAFRLRPLECHCSCLLVLLEPSKWINQQ